MTALADALVAAQRRALAAAEKHFVAGRIDADELTALLDAMGLTDAVDQERLIASLSAIQLYGAAMPSTPANGAEKPPEKATQAQRDRVKRDLVPLVGEDAAGAIATDPALTTPQASEIIDSVRAGTFNLEAWAVPF